MNVVAFGRKWLWPDRGTGLAFGRIEANYMWVRITDVPAKIWTGFLPNTSVKCHHHLTMWPFCVFLLGQSHSFRCCFCNESNEVQYGMWIKLVYCCSLFSTFVCPTEIIAFSDRIEEFRAINTEVVGVSTDSHFSHLGWINATWKVSHSVITNTV